MQDALTCRDPMPLSARARKALSCCSSHASHPVRRHFARGIHAIKEPTGGARSAAQSTKCRAKHNNALVETCHSTQMVASSLKRVVTERQATWPSPPEGLTHTPLSPRTSRSASSSQPQWRTAATRGNVNDPPRLAKPHGLTMLDQTSRSSTKRRDTRPAQPGLSHTSTHKHTARKHTASRPRGQRDATLTSTTSGLRHAPHTRHNARTQHIRSSSRPQARDVWGGSALGRRRGRPRSPLVAGEERHRLGRLELRPPPWRVELR